MKFSDLTFEKTETYDPFNSHAKANGMVKEWIARNEFGNLVAWGYTKAECVEDARHFVAAENRRR